MRKALFIAVIAVLFAFTPAWAQHSIEAGQVAASKGDFSEAMRNWYPLAVDGDGEAWYQIGLLYAYGNGVPQNFSLAKDAFKKAAAVGNADAVSALSNLGSVGEEKLEIVPLPVSKVKSSKDFRSYGKVDLWLMLFAGIVYLSAIFHFERKGKITLYTSDSDFWVSLVAAILSSCAVLVDWEPGLQRSTLVCSAIAAGSYCVWFSVKHNGFGKGVIVAPAKLAFVALLFANLATEKMFPLARQKHQSLAQRRAIGAIRRLFNSAVWRRRESPGYNDSKASEETKIFESDSDVGRRWKRMQKKASSSEFDPLKVFDIGVGFSAEELKARYHELLQKYHPDKVQNLGHEFAELANEKMKEINKAFQILSRQLH